MFGFDKDDRRRLNNSERQVVLQHGTRSSDQLIRRRLNESPPDSSRESRSGQNCQRHVPVSRGTITSPVRLDPAQSVIFVLRPAGDPLPMTPPEMSRLRTSFHSGRFGVWRRLFPLEEEIQISDSEDLGVTLGEMPYSGIPMRAVPLDLVWEIPEVVVLERGQKSQVQGDPWRVDQ